MTQYSTLYKRALAQITDPLLAQLPEEDLENMLHDWLMDAIVEPVVGEDDFASDYMSYRNRVVTTGDKMAYLKIAERL